MKEKDLRSIIAQESKMGNEKPVFAIFLMEKDGSLYDKNGRPVIGKTHRNGFFHTLDEAVEAVTKNQHDIHEWKFEAAMILCLYPGVYSYAGPDRRIYYKWDETKKAYMESDEPAPLRPFAY